MDLNGFNEAIAHFSEALNLLGFLGTESVARPFIDSAAPDELEKLRTGIQASVDQLGGTEDNPGFPARALDAMCARLGGAATAARVREELRALKAGVGRKALQWDAVGPPAQRIIQTLGFPLVKD